MYIFTEYCNGGDLDNFKNLRMGVSEKETQLIIKQLVKGLKELHQRNIMHRDLKLANALIHFPDVNLDAMSSLDKLEFLRNVDLSKSKFQIKIADLGFSKVMKSLKQLNQSILGTPLYMSP